VFCSSRRRHTILVSDWSSDVCSSDLNASSLLAMSTSNRLARAVDRARELSKQLEEAGALAAPEAGRRLRELTVTEQRSLLLLARSEERRVGEEREGWGSTEGRERNM